MGKATLLSAVMSCVFLSAACTGGGLETEDPTAEVTPAGAQSPTGEVGEALAASPAGNVPAGLPARLAIGLYEDNGKTWMRDSSVAWDLRYRYLVKGWVNGWGWSANDGSFALNYMNETAAQGRIPAFAYYEMNGQPGGGEQQFLAKTQNASTMNDYFSNFKKLMQQSKIFGKPVLVMIEADGFAYMQQQSGNNPNAYSAVAASGVPELSGLPNTAAGWGLAFLQLKKAAGANNVLLGIHISPWATSREILYDSVNDPLQPPIDNVYGFLAPSGLAANVTGLTYDVMITDPLDRDSDYYRLSYSMNRWWDPSDSASLTSSSFNRYAEWLSLWNQKAGKRWVLWQIPLGNSASLNTCNAGGARQGFKDNRTEYFFGSNGAAHRSKFAQAGVLALLFGLGEGCQASFENDYDSSGNLFMKTNAGAFLASGGLAIPTTGGTVITPVPPGPVATDSATWNFESQAQGWLSGGTLVATVGTSSAQVFKGTKSLSVAVNGAGTAEAGINTPTLKAGSTLTFHVWIPANAPLQWVQPYILEGPSVNWRWTSKFATSFTRGGWNTFTVTAPSNLTSVIRMGVQFSTTGSTGLFVDSVG